MEKARTGIPDRVIRAKCEVAAGVSRIPWVQIHRKVEYIGGSIVVNLPR